MFVSGLEGLGAKGLRFFGLRVKKVTLQAEPGCRHLRACCFRV